MSKSINQAIVIGTGANRNVWIDALIKSIKTNYPVVVVYGKSFELGVIRHIYHNTKIDEFLFLHDSCEIKDNSIFELVFETYREKSVSLAISPCVFGMYLGKYRREILDKMEIPEAHNKFEAVDYEMTFNSEYVKTDGNVVTIENPLIDGNIFVYKNGRLNMKLENEHLIKYKATWNRDMVK